MTIFATCLTLAAALSFAAPPDAPGQPDSDEQARVGDSNRYIYVEGESLEGEVLTAGGALITTRRGQEHASLIQLRRTFLDQLHLLSRDI